jgi:hypothetical protein
MAFMDYMPTFGQNVSQQTALPQDETLMQLDLKRKLALADALRQQQMPEGQMVSGRYVAPSFTQYLANAVDTYQGNKKEREALGQFGEYQKGKQVKLANLLTDLGQGKEVTAPMDYNEAGNMPGMEQTTRQPFTQQEYIAKVGGVMPELLPDFLKADITNKFKQEAPVKLSANESIGTMVNGKFVPAYTNTPTPKFADKFSNIKVDEITGKTYGINNETMKVEEIPGSTLSPKPTTPRNVQIEKLREGTKEVTYQINADGTRTKIAEGPAFAPIRPQSDSAKDTLEFNKTSKLRDEFSSLPETKAWNVIQPILVSVRDAAKDNSGGSDLNLIYGMGKVMDPNSVVREGELQLAGSTGSLGQQLQGYYKSIVNGGRLSPTVKKDLLAQIESRARPQQMLYENTKKRYTSIAQRNNLNPEDLFVEGITSPPKPRKVIGNQVYVYDGQGWHIE